MKHLDLAVFGAEPAFAEKLYVGRPNIGDEERFIGRVREIFARRWLTNNGPFVQDFERRIAEKAGVKHCVAMCNATVALEILIRALELTGEVIVPSFTFVATAHAIEWQGIKPVFCDIDPNTHNLDPKCVEQAVTENTSAILGVHLWGRPCPVEPLRELAQRRGLRLFFDAAHGFGCSYEGTMIGGFGDAEVFSFHATKFFNSFEGGAVVTNSDELARKMRLMKNFGFAGYDNVVYIGTNGKMTEVAAAMGLGSLECLDEFIATNLRNYKQYRDGLAGAPGVSLLTYDEGEKCNYQYIVLEIDEPLTHISRDQLMEILWAENVLARRYFYPGCHRMEPYLSNFPDAGQLLPETEKLAARVLVLPTGTAVGVDDITKLCDIIRTVVSNGAWVSSELGRRRQSEGTDEV